jgi:hypothetical protein
MDIFENKNHRGMIYNGSKPVRVLQSPDEGLGNLYGHLDQGGWGNQNASNLHVRHVPDPLPNVFPGNPGPKPEKVRPPLSPAMQAIRDKIARGEMTKSMQPTPYATMPKDKE